MLRRWRLITGLFLLGFVASHLLNHMLGLAGLPALEAGRLVFLALWRSPPAEALLVLAIASHLALAGYAIYRRRRLLHLPAWEAAQLLLGLLVPPLIVLHILGTVVAHHRFAVEDRYAYLFFAYLADPWEMARQFLALAVAWTHGAIGLWFWLRLKHWFPRWQDVILALLLLWPALALAGALAGLREVELLAGDREWRRDALEAIRPPDREGLAWIYAAQDWALASYGTLLAAVLALRGWRRWQESRRGLVRIVYPGNVKVGVPPGTTILEASQLRRVPHAQVCGGRGRCSTCRVRVLRGAEQLPPPTPAEARVLARIHAGPEIRLACQVRPKGDIEVLPLLPAGATPRDAQPRPGYLQGQEREIAVLFADLRGFTSLAEHKLPFDVVFLLNRYFRGMAQAVEGAGGRIDKFIGDGVMALFGLEVERATACRQALAAARAMALELAEMNRQLAHDLPQPLRLGIGLHFGPAIVGEMGAGATVSVTAIGDTVNTASRLETMTKELKAELVVSEAVALAAGIALTGAAAHELAIRGRKDPLRVLAVARAAELPAG
jgi:adenylate cyclase